MQMTMQAQEMAGLELNKSITVIPEWNGFRLREPSCNIRDCCHAQDDVQILDQTKAAERKPAFGYEAGVCIVPRGQTIG